jgi:hypothetical protein
MNTIHNTRCGKHSVMCERKAQMRSPEMTETPMPFDPNNPNRSADPVSHALATLDQRMASLEEKLEEKLAQINQLLLNQRTEKEWYTTEEFANLVGKAEFTVREWCRLGRINAKKRGSGRGPHASWAIAHEEQKRYQRDGLLSIRKN